MTNLFKPPRVDTSAQTAAMERQEDLLEKQELRAKREEADEARRLQASMRARATGGMRSLLSPMRANARTGISTGLGGMSNE
jgi:hypothetical protein